MHQRDFADADGPAREAMLRPEEAAKKRRRVRRKPSDSAQVTSE
jgi:poly(A) polymerase